MRGEARCCQDADMSEERVTISIDGGVADVRMNRPEKMNALDGAQFAAIVDAGESLKKEPGVRAVVLSGNGRAFCAGLDFGSFQQMAGGGDGGERPPREERPARSAGDMDGRITHLGQQAAWVWQELEVPVIAAVHGVALGGGCQVALGADIRIAAPDAQFSVLEIRWGLTPDMSATVLLPHLVGLDVAKELTFTGRMVTGTEAAQIGLATKVSETPLEDALAMAHEIAGKNPLAVRGAKRLLNSAPGRDVAEQFRDERETIGSLIGSPNQVEAVMAFFEKRAPVFQD
jgi:enoyl-CoA hydratase/carnithine racemase